jgi:hypothetical protein
VFRQILTHQKTLPQTNLHPLLHLPRREQAARWPVIVALVYVVASDLVRPFRVAGLRVKSMKSRRVLAGLASLLPAKDTQVEWVIGLAEKQAALSNRILFLTQMQRVFRLWHVVHKPFSYAFAVLALFHIIVAMLMGFL